MVSVCFWNVKTPSMYSILKLTSLLENLKQKLLLSQEMFHHLNLYHVDLNLKKYTFFIKFMLKITYIKKNSPWADMKEKVQTSSLLVTSPISTCRLTPVVWTLLTTFCRHQGQTEGWDNYLQSHSVKETLDRCSSVFSRGESRTFRMTRKRRGRGNNAQQQQAPQGPRGGQRVSPTVSVQPTWPTGLPLHRD